MRKSALCMFLFAICLLQGGVAQAQNRGGCPEIPRGVNQIQDLIWIARGDSVLVSIGQSSENAYLQTWLNWDIQSGELVPVTVNGVVNALQFADALGIWDAFTSENDSTQLSVSPDMQNVLYIQDSRLFTIGAEDATPRELGLVSENLADVDVQWVTDDEAIVIVEPIYGEGYESYHVCIQEDCFNNTGEQAGGIMGYPDIRPDVREMVVQVDSDIVFYDLDTQTFGRRVATDRRLLLNINPIWDAETNEVYFMGFEGVQLVLYQLDLTTEVLSVVTTLPPTIIAPTNWLLNLDQRYILFSDPTLEIYCF